MKLFSVVCAVAVVGLVSSSGCKSSKQEPPAPSPAPGYQAEPAAPKAQADDPLSGKVVETMNSGGYTYVYLEKNGRKTWVALPDSKVKVGQEITCQPGMEMRNFTSKTLNRTFESIIFSGGIR